MGLNVPAVSPQGCCSGIQAAEVFRHGSSRCKHADKSVAQKTTAHHTCALLASPQHPLMGFLCPLCLHFALPAWEPLQLHAPDSSPSCSAAQSQTSDPLGYPAKQTAICDELEAQSE